MAQVKERGGGEEVSFLPFPFPLFHFSRGQNRTSPSSVFLCSETKRQRLLRRLRSLFPSGFADERETIDKVLKNCTCLEKSSINPQYYEVFIAKQQERPFSALCFKFAFLWTSSWWLWVKLKGHVWSWPPVYSPTKSGTEALSVDDNPLSRLMRALLRSRNLSEMTGLSSERNPISDVVLVPA